MIFKPSAFLFLALLGMIFQCFLGFLSKSKNNMHVMHIIQFMVFNSGDSLSHLVTVLMAL